MAFHSVLYPHEHSKVEALKLAHRDIHQSTHALGVTLSESSGHDHQWRQHSPDFIIIEKYPLTFTKPFRVLGL